MNATNLSSKLLYEVPLILRIC